ncbi:DNA invertase [Anaerocolumna cellulosilytica]|uniref:DNA invertase n=1 Tax=Anaerocolumna cellulosilytica TaxID=433286 RepID=A0A6S6RDL1_9FIRM|nr:recombinase family protein [Anaerocolumna cellulosilytica]MBB5198122.1 DNA invertase Pin-like site-specific DNA recombinase [Anaerocolumna cellulosilytica]BCJ96811.1 DNA invertase [Anaerocolumna cellulosilytica]
MDTDKNVTYLGYIRVSKENMNLDRQSDLLIAAGVPERNIYQEKVTGTKRDREALNQMIESIKPNEKIVVVVAELSRLSRSTRDLIEIVELIHSKGADIKSLKEPWIDTTSPQSKLLFTIFAGLSQFERDLLSDRTKDGLKAAKARGRTGGRPSKRTDKAITVTSLYNNGVKIAEIVRQTALSRSTVNRIIRDGASKTCA